MDKWQDIVKTVLNISLHVTRPTKAHVQDVFITYCPFTSMLTL